MIMFGEWVLVFVISVIAMCFIIANIFPNEEKEKN